MSEKDTREFILDVAEELLLSRGFSAFSYRDISERVGIRKASIHHHFPSKESLGVALVRRFQGNYRQWFAEVDEALRDPADRLSFFCDHYHAMLGGGQRVCPAGVLAAELNALPEGVRTAVTDMVAEVLAWLAKTAEEGMAGGALRRRGSAAAVAALVLAALQGALQLGRSAGTRAMGSAVEALKSNLKT